MILSTGLEPHREDEEFLEEGAACVYRPVSPSRQKTKVVVICVFPHT